MTLIEPFDRAPLQNLAECLAIEPQHLILVGTAGNLNTSKSRHEQILAHLHMDTKVTTKPISATASLDDIRRTFEDLMRDNSPCIIDLFGGDEVLLMAAGMAYQNCKDTCDVTLQRMDMARGVALRLGNGQPQVVGTRPQLSVEDSVKLYSGVVFSSETERADNHTAEDVNPLWNIVKNNPTDWNKKLRALNFFESQCKEEREGPIFNVNLYQSHNPSTEIEEWRRLYRAIIDELEQANAIILYDNRNDRYRYRYTSPLTRACLKKEGNLLEFKTLLTAREFMRDGKPFFNDCQMGVMLDWDGYLHNPYGPDVRDTRNEIDVMVMRGCTPVFISCKNGGIEEEELYKLHTVALRLGGTFAKKVLIATDYEPHSQKTKQSLMQRAKDMDIRFETDAHTFSDADWHRFFETLFA